MDRGERSPLRLLAPVALVAFAIAFLAVVANSDVEKTASGSASGAATTGESRPAAEREEQATTEEEKPPATYTVKLGDTLAGIAERTGVTVEQLQELNPELDPQALVSGQKIKLAE